MCQKNNKYSKELKLKIAKEYLNSSISYDKLAKKYKVKSSTQVTNWVKKYQELGDKAFDTDGRGKAKGPRKGRPKTKFQSIEEEVEYLRMQVDYLKKLKEIERW